jgi:hypothetical protein
MSNMIPSVTLAAAIVSLAACSEHKNVAVVVPGRRHKKPIARRESRIVTAIATEIVTGIAAGTMTETKIAITMPVR